MDAARASTSNDDRQQSVAIVGGGLAGLAAAVALIERGVRVELFEARRKLGGRAGSYVDRTTGERIDHCQHVAMGCCTNYLDFCRRTQIADLFTRHEVLHFFGPDARRSDFRPRSWLPAPLHLAPTLLAMRYLSLSERLSIGRCLLRLARTAIPDLPGGPTVLAWLISQRQSPRAIERFWQVVLVSALGESLDRASLAAARKVFVDGFLTHRDASHVLVPRVSLGELYDERVAGWLRARGAAIHLEAPVASILGDASGATGVQLADGREQPFDGVVVAVPWRRVNDLLPSAMRPAIDPDDQFATIDAAPITGVHLWFDRPLTELPHAVLIGRLSQWVFARPTQSGTGFYYQVVISASRDLAGRERQSVVDELLDDLRRVFPAAVQAKVLRWQLITDPDAVFSVRPGLDAIRPLQATSIGGLALAGDWTRTGWPATMEGAVRSGYLAAESLLRGFGRQQRVLVPDLPQSWLLRIALCFARASIDERASCGRTLPVSRGDRYTTERPEDARSVPSP